MKVSFTFGADPREMQGKGASRRLRHTGKVPAILYGGGEKPSLVLDQQNLLTMIGNEKFYSSIVRSMAGGKSQNAIVKDVQMHPARNVVCMWISSVSGGSDHSHPAADPLPERGQLAGCEDSGRRGFPHARCGGGLPSPRTCPSSSSWIFRP